MNSPHICRHCGAQIHQTDILDWIDDYGYALCDGDEYETVRPHEAVDSDA